VVVAIVVATGLSLLIFGNPRAILAIGIMTGVFILVGGAAALSPRIDAAVKLGFSSVFTLWVWLASMALPLWIAMYVARSILTGVSPGLQVAFLVVWGVLLVGAIWAIVVPRWRTWLFSFLSPLGFLAPICYAINILVIATIFFATVSTLLSHAQLVTLLPPPERVEKMSDSTILHGMLLDFFLWHFFAELPFRVNETLQWNEPMRYQSAGMGLILLLFKAAVIGPVIALFVLWWKQRTGAEPEKAPDKAA